MRVELLVAALLTCAYAYPAAHSESSLFVTLERANITHVEALDVNEGTKTPKLVTTGTLLDSHVAQVGNKPSVPGTHTSNTILAITSTQSAKVPPHHPQPLARRALVASDCQGPELQAVKTALKTCAIMARRAANSVDNRAKMITYFKSISPDVADTVRSVFHKIAQDCERTMSGFAHLRCVDIWNGCNHEDYLAAAASSIDEIVVCPSFFTLSPLSSTCHEIDQPGTLIHEMTHLNQVQSTSDDGGYGYNAVRTLQIPHNLKHADTYRLFAQSFFSTSPEKC